MAGNALEPDSGGSDCSTAPLDPRDLKPALVHAHDSVRVLYELPECSLFAADVVSVGVVVHIDNGFVAETKIDAIDVATTDRDRDPGVTRPRVIARVGVVHGGVLAADEGRYAYQLIRPLTRKPGEYRKLLSISQNRIIRLTTMRTEYLAGTGIGVTPLVGPTTPIVLQPEQRVWIYKDGRQPQLLPLSVMEIMKLQMMHDAGIAPLADAD